MLSADHVIVLLSSSEIRNHIRRRTLFVIEWPDRRSFLFCLTAARCSSLSTGVMTQISISMIRYYSSGITALIIAMIEFVKGVFVDFEWVELSPLIVMDALASERREETWRHPYGV